MFNIYGKLAVKVLGRSPFFTGVSLFGISFTLAVLMLMIAYFQCQFGARPPFGQADRLVFLTQLEQREVEQDTTWQIDSSLVKGQWIKDSLPLISELNTATSQSCFDIGFLETYFSKDRLTTAERVSIVQHNSFFDLFHNNKKININVKFVDQAYFEVFDFQLLEGRFLKEADVRQASRHIVITEELADWYFGSRTGLTGQQMLIDNNLFEVKGVVKKAKTNHQFVNGDAFIPLTYLDRERDKYGYFGPYAAVVQCKTQNTKAAQEEIKSITANIPFLDPSQSNGARFNFMLVHADNHFQHNAKAFFYSKDPEESARKFSLVTGFLIILFCGVPLLNLVKINAARVLGRSTEIGVRKAFGATSGDIIRQVVFEHIILTLLGGLIGLGIALLIMYAVNRYQWLDNIRLSLDLPFFVYSLLTAIAFGVLSGYAPALRISRSSIVHALKNR